MKMLKIKNVLKLSAGVLFASAFACQAYAGDIALAGTYGNYLQAGCSWTLASSNNYGPTQGVPNGATTNGVQVDIHYLLCGGNTAPQAVKVVQTNYTFIYPNPKNRTQTSQSCGINSAQATAVGNCTNHRVYN
jgi:hypothetical protein